MESQTTQSKVQVIQEFKDDYRFLSNFYYLEKPIKYDELYYPTVEHFYVAMKTTSGTLREAVSKHPLKGLKAFGKTFELRDDWDTIKTSVMLYGLLYKFSEHNPSIRKALIDTGDAELVEGNYWNDTYWGVSLKTGEGQNKLGKMLMNVRTLITHERTRNRDN